MSTPSAPVSLRGQTPTISCVNKAKTDMGVNFRILVDVLQKFVDSYFFPVWGTPCKLVITPSAIPKNNWAIVFLDKPTMRDGNDAEGFHDLTKHGLPLSKVFVKTTIDEGELVSVTAAHELAEMLVDPGLQMGALKPHVGWYAYETADAVEETTFNIDGVAVSDFVYPAWFESYRKPHSTQFDYCKLCTRPFELLEGGYTSIFRGGHWSDKFGSKAKEKRFKHARHLRNAQRRKRGPLRRSTTA